MTIRIETYSVTRAQASRMADILSLSRTDIRIVEHGDEGTPFFRVVGQINQLVLGHDATVELCSQIKAAEARRIIFAVAITDVELDWDITNSIIN